MGYFPDSIKVQPSLTDKCLALETVDPKRLGVDLHGCTTLGSSHDLLKMQLLTTVQCTVYAYVLWKSTFLHFIQHVLFVPCLLQCVYVYVCISVSLSFTSPSLWKSL